MNKRIEYKVGSNKVLAIFVNINKGASIQLFNYSQLNTKQGGLSNKSTFSHVMAFLESALNNKRNI